MIFKNKNALISIFEIVFILTLFSGAIIYFTTSHNLEEKDYKFTIETSLDRIYYDVNNRGILFDEDLSQTSLTQNWTNISTFLNSTFLNYELILSNKTVDKIIFNCSSLNEKYFSEKVISIKNNTVFEFRKIKLGVCY